MGFRIFGGGSDNSWADQGMISEMRSYWEALREDGQLPNRHQINPRGMAGTLENAFLIERIGTGLGQFRIAGFAFHQLMGTDVRGMPFSCLFLGESRMRLQMDLERLFHGPSCVSLSLTSPADFRRPKLAARLSLFPVADEAGRCTLALGCIEIGGPIGPAPRRFAIAESVVERLSLPEKPAAFAVPKAVQPIGPNLAKSHVQTQKPASRPHLRLVHSVD